MCDDANVLLFKNSKKYGFNILHHDIFSNKTHSYTLRRKGYISATYLEPLKGSIQNPFKGFFGTRKKVLFGTFCVHSFSFVLSFPD